MTTLQNVMTAGNFKSTARLGQMCDRIYKNPEHVYPLIGNYGGEADSVTREAIFSFIADKYYKGNYNKIYDRWLNNSEESKR
jgi:hypothetical protein